MKHPLIFIIAVVLASSTSCKKMQVAEVNTAISNEESATMIATALSSNANGLNNLVTDISANSANLYINNIGCGTVYIDSLTRQNPPGAVTSFSFKQKTVSGLNCNANKGFESISSNITFNGQCNGPKLATKGNGSANITVTGIGQASPSFTINGQLKNMCGFKMKADTTRKGTISIKIDLKNITVAKAGAGIPAMITGGSATASVTGNSAKGAFLFEGTLAFNGFNEASLSLNKENYLINLSTGALVKK